MTTDSGFFPTQLQQLQFADKYSRWNNDKQRRETWDESVARAVAYLIELSDNKLDNKDYTDIYNAMLNMEAFSSMRLFAMAGEAARRCNSVLYNCSYIAIDSIKAFSEILYLSMSGTGVGFSVEKEFVNNLPVVLKQKENNIKEHDKNKLPPAWLIEDSQEGWAEAFYLGLSTWFSGFDCEFDYSAIRPIGSILKTKGGRASGPDPLEKLLNYSREVILNAQGRQLKPIEVHDIVCMIGDCAVSGGSRRSAMISLFDRDDKEMLHAKDYGWWKTHPQRANANNSVVIDTELSRKEVSDIMYTMHNGGGGEPGFYMRKNAGKMAQRREFVTKAGTNPCGEIDLNSRQFCNLSQAIIRDTDTKETLKEKVRIATIIGTIQSMATKFKYISKEWAENTARDRLLGVDLTGQLDNPNLITPELLEELRDYAIEINEKYAAILGIEPSVAITCNKPSGNSSILFNCAPGIHSRWSDYYIRRVRINANSPMRHTLEQSGFVLHPENGQQYETATTLVAEFPVKAPEGAITNGSRNALEQCEWWKMNKLHWTEQNPSVTISYTENEIEGLIDWVYNNQNIIGGMSFLEKDNHYYPLAPYEKIDVDTYNKMLSELPKINFDLLKELEHEDQTTIAQEVACVGGLCLI